jgi:hypothetical protein
LAAVMVPLSRPGSRQQPAALGLRVSWALSAAGACERDPLAAGVPPPAPGASPGLSGQIAAAGPSYLLGPEACTVARARAAPQRYHERLRACFSAQTPALSFSGSASFGLAACVRSSCVWFGRPAFLTAAAERCHGAPPFAPAALVFFAPVFQSVRSAESGDVGAQFCACLHQLPRRHCVEALRGDQRRQRPAAIQRAPLPASSHPAARGVEFREARTCASRRAAVAAARVEPRQPLLPVSGAWSDLFPCLCRTAPCTKPLSATTTDFNTFHPIVMHRWRIKRVKGRVD